MGLALKLNKKYTFRFRVQGCCDVNCRASYTRAGKPLWTYELVHFSRIHGQQHDYHGSKCAPIDAVNVAFPHKTLSCREASLEGRHTRNSKLPKKKN